MGDLKAKQPPRPVFPKVIPVPPFMTKALKANPAAWEFFNKLAPSHRRRYTGWILLAKREETREKRLERLIEVSAAGKRI